MAITESFGRGKIVEAITNTQATPFVLTVSKLPNNDNQFVTINPNSDNEEIFFYTTRTGTAGEAGTLNITGRGYNKQNATTDVANQNAHKQNVEYKLALNHIIINDKVDTKLDNVVESEIVFSATDKVGLTVNTLTTAERDALTPTNGAIIYNSTTGGLEQYVSGAWQQIGVSGVASATETSEGIVERATDAEAAAGVDTTRYITSKHLADATPSADEATEGLVERATDAEATTGTDTTRYITPKQGKDNYEVDMSPTASIVTGSSAPTASVYFAKGGLVSFDGDIINSSGSSRVMVLSLQYSTDNVIWNTAVTLHNGDTNNVFAYRNLSYWVSPLTYIRGFASVSGTNCQANIRLTSQARV